MDQWSLDEWTNRVDLPPVHGKAGQSVLPMVAGAKGHGAELRGQGLALHIENLQHLALVSKVRALARVLGIALPLLSANPPTHRLHARARCVPDTPALRGRYARN
jgi:hypothetical protein